MSEESKLEIKAELINGAMAKALGGWNVHGKMEQVAAEVLGECLKAALKELEPQIKEAMADALKANLAYMTKSFVRTIRENY